MKILIWGAGNTARDIIDNDLNADVIGFIESKRSSDTFLGLPVFEYPTMPSDYDMILICTVYAGAVYRTLSNEGFDMSRVLFFYDMNGFLEYRSDFWIREMLGERNHALYATNYRAWKGTFFEDDINEYNRLNRNPDYEIRKECIRPFLMSKFMANGDIHGYFWMDLWGAKHVIQSGVKEHYDIGSRVDGFISHLLASGIKVYAIDVRPMDKKIDNLNFIIDDASKMSSIQDDSIGSLTSLCSPEHFGLGRYGDPIDPDGSFRFFSVIQDKMKKGGSIYICVPIGKDHLEFNAERVFSVKTVLECFDRCSLKEYSVIDDNGIHYDEHDFHKYDDLETTHHVDGLFHFIKN